MAIKKYYGTGRRKSSIARVFLSEGKGKMLVNGLDIKDYFNRATHLMIINQPFEQINKEDKFDAYITVKGGGGSGQAGAVRHGIARALLEADANNRPPLKSRGLLTRDARVVERKKVGLKKARKKSQFSKR